MKEKFDEQKMITISRALDIIRDMRPDLRHENSKVLQEAASVKLLPLDLSSWIIDPAPLVRELTRGTFDAIDDALSVLQILEWMKGDLKSAINSYRKVQNDTSDLTTESLERLKRITSFYRAQLKELRRVMKQERDEAELKRSLKVYEPLGLAIKLEDAVESRGVTKNTKTRLLKALNKEGLTYAFQLMEYSKKDLKKLPGIGIKGANILDKFLLEYGESFKSKMKESFTV